ncbi:lipase family protein [Olsenella profusa]|uniref:Fungal lipase-type domain-containing protein n=1 Tax=Olsenella profusa TaxID=138595 RepID=A0ABS2EZY5_9ACTN|nr:hypothetical protein [Olsenella profusa]MBM6774286.1 hypothetical protein [Olsenella profusa]
MRHRLPRGRRRRRGVLLALLVTAVLAGSATLAGAAVLHVRRLDRVSGTGAVAPPAVDARHREGRFSTKIEYGALFSAEGHQVSSMVTWDDAWFFQDAFSYNHELAHTCAVLSAVANAESAYYQQGSTSPAYAEHAFAALGFDEVCTASYRYRSEVLDEVLSVVDGTDVVAYTLATKRVTDPATGAQKLLTVVVVRGSYGSEWLSNIKIEGESELAGSGAGSGDEQDHLGFTLAANEIVADLERRAAEAGSGLERTYLFCGHSRGGAVANLLASYADDVSDGSRAIATAADVRAYTFATPNCTSATGARLARYGNVFNVLNPSDLVPELPLSSWGYTRYGCDVWLPGAGEAAFEARVAACTASYQASMGVACPADPDDRQTVARFVDALGARVGSLDELVSPGGLLELVGALSSAGVDPARLLASHYPNTYIAWLDATDAGDLRFSTFS